MMTVTEGITGFIASVIAILTAMVFLAKYLDRRFHKWAESVISDSETIRNLTNRLATVEGALHTMETIIGVSNSSLGSSNK